MKNNRFYVSIVALMSAVLFAACANLGSMQKHMADLSFTAAPNPLELHGDSIEITYTPDGEFRKLVSWCFIAEGAPAEREPGSEG